MRFRRKQAGARNAAGMMLSLECAVYFWLGWVAWLLALAGACFGEYIWRVPEPPGAYLFEALVMMLSWVITLAAADHTVISYYRTTWHMLFRQTVAPLVLESKLVDRIRQELTRIPLLRPLRPPPSSDIRGQLMTVALWWQAVTAPEESGVWRRYGEWLVDVLGGYLPLVVGVIVLMAWPERRGLATASLLGAVAMAVLGYSLIRLAGRRQAVLDYFQAWLVKRDEAEEKTRNT